MQTTVDKRQFPAQSFGRRTGSARPRAARVLLRVLAATLAVAVFTAGVARSQNPNQPATSGTPIKPALSKTSLKISPIADQSEASQLPALTAMSLEEMLATALKDNPDIHVAEAKLREAETELNRVRLDVAQKVSIFRREWEVQQARIEEYETRLKEAEKLMSAKAISQEEYRLTQVNVRVNRALLTKLEAELPYLLGRARQGTSVSRDNAAVTKSYALNTPPSDDFVRELHQILIEIDHNALIEQFAPNNSLIIKAAPAAHTVAASVILALKRAHQPLAARTRSRSEMEQKILKALDTPIEASFQDKPLDELFKDFRKSFGIPFVLDPASFGGSGFAGGGGDPNPKVTLDLGEVPLAIVLEAIQDTVRVYFRVREYGIHVSRNAAYGRDESGVVDFWKRERQSGEKLPQR